MSGAPNYDKLWLQSSINRAAVRRVYEAIRAQGRAMPCSVTAVSGSIVTVKFEVNAAPWPLPTVTIPKAESQWIRNPTQKGDYGIAVPAGTFLGGITGLGTGVATLALQGNLSTLYFLPIASTTFPEIPDLNQAFVCGPDGVLLQTLDGKASVNIGESGITLTFGSKIVTLNASGLTIDGILWETHEHTGVQTGSSNTGGPVAG